MTHKNHIEQLIHDLCPNGVNYMPLGEIERKGLISLGRGNVISKKDIAKTPGNYPIYSSSGQGNGEMGRYGLYMFSDKRITWSIDGGGKFFFRDDLFYSVTNVCGWLKVNKADLLNIKYLYYVLYEQWTHKVFDYTVKAHPSVIRDSYKIPLPSLPIQEEIVRILDAFANLIENIDNEIKERERQLGLYLVAILEHIKEDSKSWYKLGDICYQPKERISAEELSPDNYIGVENMLQNKQGVTSSTCVPSTNAIKYIYGDILLGNIRPNLRKIWMADRIGGTNGDVVTLRRYDKFKEFLFPRYLYYILSDESFFVYNIQYSRGAKMPRGNKEKILAYPIPLPSLAEQRAIAEKLDTIEAFIANLKEERALRQQQYEYYREYLINLLK